MARPLRIEFPGAWYHVMNRGKRGEKTFFSPRDHWSFIGLLKDSVEMFRLRVTAYCLMPNHYHLLVQTPEGNLSRAMRHINSVYTQHFNRHHEIDGPLFRGRYKSILVEEDTYLLGLVRYIHLNPLRAALADNLGAYRWSSHLGYLSTASRWNWLYKEPVLSRFDVATGKPLENYLRFMTSKQEKFSNTIDWEKTPPVLGSTDFVERIKNRFYEKKLDGEVPEAKQLAPDIETIHRAVCQFFSCEPEYLLQGRRGRENEPRRMAVYLCRRLRGDTLREIAQLYGMRTYHAASSIIASVERKIKTEPAFRHKLLAIRASIQNAQNET